MSNQSSENYLDQLLNAVNTDVPKREIPVEKLNTAESAVHTEETYESMLEDFVSDSETEGEGPKMSFSDMDLYEAPVAKSEDDFIREFEAELSNDDFEELLEDYETRMGVDDIQTQTVESDTEIPTGLENILPTEEDLPEMTESVDDILEKVAADMGKEEEVSEEVSVADLMAGNIDGEDMALEDLPMETTEEGVEAGEEPNLSGFGDDDDLLSLLSATGDFVDLGDMLENSDNGELSDSEDVFGAFAESELEKQISDQEETKEDGTQAKKGGFLDALMARFFGKKNNDKVKLSSAKGASAEELSDENEAILAELDDVDGHGLGSRGKKKIKKENPKKDKTAKAKTDKKPKAPKAAKPKKPKKEKKPKEVDKTPPLPKKPVFLIWVAAISLFALVIIGTNLSSYSIAMKEAKALFDGAHYAKAYKELSGVSIKDKDVAFYNQLSVLAPADAEYEHYEVFLKNNEQIRALDSLICAAGRCEINIQSAKTYECLNYLEILQLKVENELRDQYGITYEEAVEMYTLYDRDDYTVALYEKIEELDLQ